jgi:2,3-bisphosphoglycerate-independent phosphoglycerate mutase
LEKYYPGRGPIEAVSQGIKLAPDDIAFRCNLVHTKDGILVDYSAGHVSNKNAEVMMLDIQKNFGSDKVTFHSGVSYRNIMVLHGKEFSLSIECHKPDSCQGMKLSELDPMFTDNSFEAKNTVQFIKEITAKTANFLRKHPLNKGVKNPANSIWAHSPGRNPALPKFSDLYEGKKGAIISAVDVIFGLGICTGMDVIKVPGATGFIDTNYKGKADAAIRALDDHDLVYLHVEAIDECSHMGDLKLKLKAIEDFDSNIVGPVLSALEIRKGISFALLPDHPVPVKLRKHTRTPVPVAILSPYVPSDSVTSYSEKEAEKGSLGLMKNNELMKLLLNIK